jgi:hypothetical protein
MMRSLLPAAAFLFVMLASFACSGSKSSHSAATATPTPDAAAIIKDASAAMANVHSFHFILKHENGTSPMPLDLQLVSAEGDIIVPDRLKATVKATAASLNIEVDVAAIGDQTWITNPFTRKWQTLPGASIKDIADPVSLIEAATTGLHDVAYSGSDKIDGADTLVLTGKLDSGALRQALTFAQNGHTVSVKVWIGADDKLPRRIRVEGPLTGAEKDNIVRQIDLSSFNDSKIEITAPQ